MKVLFIAPEFSKQVSGGLGTVIHSVAFPLSHKVELDVLNIERCNPYTFSKNIANCTLYKVRNGSLTENVISLKCLKDAYHLLQGYDILHFFHYSQEVAELISFVKTASLPAKIIFSCHYLLKYEQHTRCIYQDLLNVEKYIYTNVDCVHVLNKTSQHIVTGCYPGLRQKAKIVIIPNGITHYGYSPDYQFNRKINPGDFVILTVSRWCHGKGLECLLDAVPLVLNKYPDVKFIIGGRKEISWENKGREYVEQIDKKIACFPENVFPLGWLTKEEIGSLLKRANLWVFPSELEYFPYGLLEPMMYKVPIITARFPGFSEIIAEGKECLAFQPGSKHELAGKIIYLMENQKIRTHLGMRAYAKAISKYTWDAVAKQYDDMYLAIKKK